MTQQHSELNKSAQGYVASFLNGEAFPGGFSFRTDLTKCNLDFSMDSLKRIDALLDYIRDNISPQFETFIDNPANQHFMHLIAFYAGQVAAKNAGLSPEWYSREEAIALVPQLKHLWPDDMFETSIICMVRPKGLHSLQYPPMLSVSHRLFTGEKSVWGSAQGFKLTADKPAQSSAPEGLFKKFRRILNGL